jgi:hypothetical protein
MATYRFRWNGPSDAQIADQVGAQVTGVPVEPPVTKDVDLDDENFLPALQDGMAGLGWVYVGEVT